GSFHRWRQAIRARRVRSEPRTSSTKAHPSRGGSQSQGSRASGSPSHRRDASEGRPVQRLARAPPVPGRGDDDAALLAVAAIGVLTFRATGDALEDFRKDAVDEFRLMEELNAVLVRADDAGEASVENGNTALGGYEFGILLE